MNVLVVNAGSSSLKYQLFDTATDAVLAKGICERIGEAMGEITHKVPGKEPYQAQVKMESHSVATKMVVDALTDSEHGVIDDMSRIEAVGHRIVHGGDYFFESVLVTPEALSKLELCRDIAPLHTGPHLMGIAGCLDVMPNVPQVLVFDTAFHQTMPEEAYFYGVPYKFYRQYKIRKYGFHGTSHRYVSGEMNRLLGERAKGSKIIVCHLGNGSSISAVQDGKVIDTTMGFTPLDGLIMGTRSGAIDPAVVTFLMEKENMTPSQMNQYLNKQCGLGGISEYSSDFRDLESAWTKDGNEQAGLAIRMLAYQIKKYIGSFAAAMNGLDALVFTAGIGENQQILRKMVCEKMDYLGIALDQAQNEKTKGGSGITRLSTDDSRVLVYMIPTNEELVIASDTEKIVQNLRKNG